MATSMAASSTGRWSNSKFPIEGAWSARRFAPLCRQPSPIHDWMTLRETAMLGRFQKRLPKHDPFFEQFERHATTLATGAERKRTMNTILGVLCD